MSFLRGIAVVREKIGGIAVLRFYSAVCGIVIYQHPKFMKYHFPDKERSIFETNSWRKGKHGRMGILFVFLHLFNLEIPGESEKTWGVWRTVTPHLAIRLS